MKIQLEEEKVEERWDLKRILIGVTLLLIFLGIGFYYLLNLVKKENIFGRRTLGVSAKNEEREVPPLPTKDDISRIISGAQQTLSQITYENVTSSQAAIQKIIKDLNLLEGKNEGNVICQILCKK